MSGGVECPAALAVAPGDEAVVVTLVVRAEASGQVVEASPLEESELGRIVAAESLRCRAEPGIWVVDRLVPPAPLSVVGQLRSQGEGRWLAGLTVAAGNQRVRTDEEGRFRLRGLPPGEVALRTDSPGWAIVGGPLVVPQSDEVTVWAEPRAGENEVVATYRPTIAVGTDRRLDRDAIAKAPGSIGDPLRAAHQWPGMARSPLDAGWVLVRGGDETDTALTIDQVPVPAVFHLGGFTTTIHPDLVGGVSFQPGATPASTGSGLSGALGVDLRPPGDAVFLRAGVNPAFAQGFAEVPWVGPGGQPGGVQVGFRRSWLDGALAAVLGPEGAQIAPRFTDLQAQVTVGPHSLYVLGMTDSLTVPTGDGATTVEFRQEGVSAQGKVAVEVPKGKLWLRPYVLARRQVIDDPRGPQTTQGLTPGLRLDWKLLPKSPGKPGVELGLVGQSQRYTFNLGDLGRKAPVTQLSPYGELWFGKTVAVRVGLRGEAAFVRDQLPRFALSPRGALTWTVFPALQLVAEGGRFHALADRAFLIGLAEGRYLPWERSDTASVGLRVRNDVVQAELHGWYRGMAQLAELEQDGSLGQLEGRAYGGEATVEAHIANITARVLYQLGRSERREEPGQPWALHRLDQPQRLEFTVLAELPKNWALSGRFRATSGWLAFPGMTSAYDILTQQDVPVDITNDRLPGFNGLDVKVNKTIWTRATRIDLYLDVQNAWNRRIPEPVITGIDNVRGAYGYGLPILPLLGVDVSAFPRFRGRK